MTAQDAAFDYLATHPLALDALPVGEDAPRQLAVWPLALKAVLLNLGCLGCRLADASSLELERAFGESGLRCAVAMAADAHASLRDDAWAARQADLQAELRGYVPAFLYLLPSVDVGPAFVAEVFADALVLVAWMIEVEFFRSGSSADLRRAQLRESVLTLSRTGAAP